ncbi:transcriptional regulator [Sphaerisporangium krabiense]|uniref:DNA-binding XRE family transcriptional regulator n=1 Tax=Sphaerisporangium krabiense TaxID=763782 RepID=A0A7W9DRA9_9ACTN|nr:helix-turn-helix transcriptional regulator [Sphaerisporangium krabiense]MBB5628268.1 DNA-binding XRE family transcriptional regulator [Sphaerisporangium krabiense]GII66263.1 transcriptional regulator [Sphaerisporangium krabiense]
MAARQAGPDRPGARQAGRTGPWAEFGARMRGWRGRAGFTQAQVGALVGYDHSAISKLESGARQPSDRLARRLDEVLGAGGALLAAYRAVTAERGRQDGTGRADPLPGGAPGPLVPDGLVLPSLLPSYGIACPLHPAARCEVPPPTEALSPGAPDGGAAGADTVHLLCALLAACWRAGDERPAGGTAAAVERALHLIAGWTGEATGRTRQALVRLAGAYALLAGELRASRGQNGMAMAWLHKCRYWAAMSDDAAAHVAALCDMATIARLEHDAPSAITYAGAVREAYPGRRWAAVMAGLCEARAHALIGDARECRRGLDGARDLLHGVGARDLAEAPWLAEASGQVYVESAAAGALRDLAAMTADRSLARLAIDAAGRSLACLGPGRRAARVLFTLRLADGHACAGDLDAAVAIAEPLLAELPALPTPLIGQELYGLRGRLVARWGNRPGTRDFAVHLGAAWQGPL